MKIEWDVCARIVAQEVRRLRWHIIGGYISSDDLSQELSIAALRSAQRHDGRKGEAYIRTSVRNAMRKLYERAYAAKRYPQDRYGRPVSLAVYDDRFFREARISPEEKCSHQEQLRLIFAQLNAEDKERFEQFASGREEIDLKFVRRVLARIDLSNI
jgi:DNA-directed RNA polymerase specialized sigma24 family protein